jgi:ketosteroid isomerase-like protein
MKMQPQPRNPNIKRRPGDHEPVRQMFAEEQTASTSISSEQAWLMIALALVVLTVGLYWFSDRHNDQPAWSYEAMVDDQTAAESQNDAATSDLSLSDSENHPMPIGAQNERLVRRFYDDVINQRQLAEMNELFAEDFSYRQSGLTTTRLNLAALKQALRAENAAYAGLQYSIEQVTTNEDLVQVDWSAGGTPLISFEAHPPTGDPQVWSGHSIWQVADGKIIQMWTYNAAGSQP